MVKDDSFFWGSCLLRFGSVASGAGAVCVSLSSEYHLTRWSFYERNFFHGILFLSLSFSSLYIYLFKRIDDDQVDDNDNVDDDHESRRTTSATSAAENSMNVGIGEKKRGPRYAN